MSYSPDEVQIESERQDESKPKKHGQESEKWK